MKSNGATVSPNGAYEQGACIISSGIDTAGCDSDAMQLTLWVKGDVLTCDDVNVEFCYGVGGCRPENDTTMDPYERFTTWDAADCTAVCAMSPGCASSAYNTYVAQCSLFADISGTAYIGDGDENSWCYTKPTEDHDCDHVHNASEMYIAAV